MPAQIQPIIGSVQDVADYMGFTNGQLTGNIPSGVITLNNWLQRCLNWTATQLVQWLDYDWTPGQVQNITEYGNGLQYADFPFPIATIASFFSWDPSDPTTAPINIGGAALAPQANNPYRLIRSDGGYFSRYLEYTISITQATDPNVFAQWPQEIPQVQLEMVAVLYRESFNFEGTGQSGQNPNLLGTDKFENYLKDSTTYIELTPRWKDRIRSRRRIAI